MVFSAINYGRIVSILEPCYHPGVKLHSGTILQIGLAEGSGSRVSLACPPAAIPAPGQYLLAHRRGDQEIVAPVPLFRGGSGSDPANEDTPAFTAAPPIPDGWQPGDELLLRGPLGRGFSLPKTTSRLALAALGQSAERLLPLAGEVIKTGGEVALFTDAPLPRLPLQVEVNPLNALAENAGWAEFIAFDGTPQELAQTYLLLGLRPDEPLPCPAQALVVIPMPCGGLADCGVCAVNAKGGYRLACLDGPVFDWGEIAL